MARPESKPARRSRTSPSRVSPTGIAIPAWCVMSTGAATSRSSVRTGIRATGARGAAAWASSAATVPWVSRTHGASPPSSPRAPPAVHPRARVGRVFGAVKKRTDRSVFARAHRASRVSPTRTARPTRTVPSRSMSAWATTPRRCGSTVVATRWRGPGPSAPRAGEARDANPTSGDTPDQGRNQRRVHRRKLQERVRFTPPGDADHRAWQASTPASFKHGNT